MKGLTLQNIIKEAGITWRRPIELKRVTCPVVLLPSSVDSVPTVVRELLGLVRRPGGMLILQCVTHATNNVIKDWPVLCVEKRIATLPKS